jgi:nucleoside-diphosphate-sugar epimerase
MKVAVTGATGFVGAGLVTRLRAGGDDVRALVLASDDAEQLSARGARIVRGDVRDLAAVRLLLRDCELVYHLAGLVPGKGRSPTDYFAVNVDGTANVGRAALELGVRHLVHCSTVSVFGVPAAPLADEGAPLHPSNVYGVTKLAAERVVEQLVRDHGLSAVIARPMPLYGPGDVRGARLFRDIARGRLVMLGRGAPHCQLGHVDDVITGLVHCGAGRPSHGECFILGGAERPTVAELLAMIAAECGVPLRPLQLPAAPLALASRLYRKLRNPAAALPAFFDRCDFFLAERTYSIERARRELGFEPRIELREGIRDTLRWYRERGLL